MSFCTLSSPISSPSDFENHVFSFLNDLTPSQELPVCFTCCDVICDQYYLRAGDNVWHEECMHCCVCQGKLEGHSSCFYKDGNIFCRRDFNDIFQNKRECNSCSRSIQSGDWVRSAEEFVFHLACFTCSVCHRQLSTGEYFAINEGNVLCRTHARCPNADDLDRKKKCKRFRTSFTDEQMAILQRHFDVNSNPSTRDLVRIGQEAGLSKRVTKVWFQNLRAKGKRFT